MKTSFLIFSIAFFMFGSLEMTAQEIKISTEISKDTILAGNKLSVSYIVNGGAITDFSPPDLSGFEILAGPNVSSSFSMINGEVSQQASYTFILLALEVGDFKIGEAKITIGENVHQSESKTIHVLENPDGDIMDDLQQRALPKPKYKKKRKTYKI